MSFADRLRELNELNDAIRRYDQKLIARWTADIERCILFGSGYSTPLTIEHDLIDDACDKPLIVDAEDRSGPTKEA
jgi:hypothetical protein